MGTANPRAEIVVRDQPARDFRRQTVREMSGCPIHGPKVYLVPSDPLAILLRDQPALMVGEHDGLRFGKRRLLNTRGNYRDGGACGERCQNAAAVKLDHRFPRLW